MEHHTGQPGPFVPLNDDELEWLGSLAGATNSRYEDLRRRGEPYDVDDADAWRIFGRLLATISTLARR